MDEIHFATCIDCAGELTPETLSAQLFSEDGDLKNLSKSRAFWRRHGMLPLQDEVFCPTCKISCRFNPKWGMFRCRTDINNSIRRWRCAWSCSERRGTLAYNSQLSYAQIVLFGYEFIQKDFGYAEAMEAAGFYAKQTAGRLNTKLSDVCVAYNKRRRAEGYKLLEEAEVMKSAEFRIYCQRRNKGGVMSLERLIARHIFIASFSSLAEAFHILMVETGKLYPFSPKSSQKRKKRKLNTVPAVVASPASEKDDSTSSGTDDVSTSSNSSDSSAEEEEFLGF